MEYVLSEIRLIRQRDENRHHFDVFDGDGEFIATLRFTGVVHWINDLRPPVTVDLWIFNKEGEPEQWRIPPSCTLSMEFGSGIRAP